MIKIRKAVLWDIDSIKELIDQHTRSGLLLPVSREKIAEIIRDFIVAVTGNHRVVGIVALHIYSDTLAEVRSLAVKKSYQGKGLGTRLVEKCMTEAENLGIKRIFALTKAVDFFKSIDFEDVDMDMLPEKVYKDCLSCKKFHQCDEIAVWKKLKP